MTFQVLRTGSRGQDVRVLQNLLNTRLSPRPNLNPDGDFGTKTRRAVRAFQRDNRLVVDGVVGARSWEALREGEENETGLLDDISAFFKEKKASIVRPSAFGLAKEFAKFGNPYTVGRTPCRRSRDSGVSGPNVRHQCAVRMSVALCRSMGGDIFDAYQGGGVHSSRCCAGDEEDQHRHITGATDLKSYLQNSLGFRFAAVPRQEIIESHKDDRRGHFRRYERLAIAEEIAKQISTQKGIIYFRHCFPNHGRLGSHIDYWNGSRYTNTAAGTGGGGKRLFFTADQIYFCPL